MSTGERRIPAAVPLFAALIAAIGASLWPGCSATQSSISASASPEVAASELESVAVANVVHAGLTREIRGIIRRGVDQAAQKGAKRGASRVSVFVKQLGGNNYTGTLVSNDGSNIRPTIWIQGQYPNVVVASNGNGTDSDGAQ